MDSLQSATNSVATHESNCLPPPRKDGCITLAIHLRQYKPALLAANEIGRNDDMRFVPQALGPLEVDAMMVFVEPALLGVELEVLHL